MQPEPSQIGVIADLIRDGGPVLIATVSVGALVYLGWRFIHLPAMRLQSETAKANRATAEQHRLMSAEMSQTAEACRASCEANARTAIALEKITDRILQGK